MAKRMTKAQALYKITQFGRTEQHTMIEAGNHHEAYQFEHARNQLLYALVNGGVNAVRIKLMQMTTIVKDNPFPYVFHDGARALLIEFAKDF